MLLLAHNGNVLPLGSRLGGERPLGAALVGRLDGSILDGLATALGAHSLSPWCPLVLSAHVALPERALRELRPDTGGIVTLYLEPDREQPTFDEVRAVVGRRGPPSVEEVVDYVARRTQDGLAGLVRQALNGADSWTSALRRRLNVQHAPSPQHWSNLLSLATYLSAAEYPHPRTLEQVALEFDRAPRTVSAWCARYLDCTWPEARNRLGWEWVIELALRAAGQASPLGSPPPGGAEYLAIGLA